VAAAAALGAVCGGVIPTPGTEVGAAVGAASPRTQVVRVVAAENVWGSVAAQIGGRGVRVTSIISSPNADPHLFATDATDAAALARAQVVVENGAGYDPWMRSLLSADGGNPRLVDVASVLHVAGDNPNPHLWYAVGRLHTVAAAIARALTRTAPGDAVMFRAHLATFDASLRPLESTIASIRSRFHGVGVAYTERVPGYVVAAAHLDDKTPPGFAQSVEDGVDPAVADTVAMRRLLEQHDVRVLLYNVQTVTPVTTQMRALARRHGIPVVGVSETMPAGLSYQQWQLSQLRALLYALSVSRNP
jgi:zinc/manganese transport system substrate-binding protein